MRKKQKIVTDLYVWWENKAQAYDQTCNILLVIACEFHSFLFTDILEIYYK